MEGSPPDKPRSGESSTGGSAASWRGSAASVAETEDFLYHLYRGSEMLQDSRVLEAKEEIEQALRLQPRDAKGQDLLAVVYFRLGLYPRAIEIYEELTQAFPKDPSLGKNLGLCYLKTGQAERARLLLEQVSRTAPDDLRAWAYLGLACERLGEYEKARSAFERAQQHTMAKRMDGMLGGTQAPASYVAGGPVESLRPSRMGRFQELDGYAALDPESEVSADRAGEPDAPATTRSDVPPPARRPSWPVARQPFPFAGSAFPTSLASGALTDPVSLPVGAAGDLVRDSLLAFPREPGLNLHASGLVLARVADTFATRLSAVLAISTISDALETTPLFARVRGRDSERPLGDGPSPIVRLTGADHVMLAAHSGAHLLAFKLDDDFLYVRENALVAFESGLAHENGQLSAADAQGNDPNAVPMVLLRGKGGLVLEVTSAPVTVEIKAGRFSVVRREAVLGWTGRLLCYGASDQTGSLPGGSALIRFVGDGALLLDPTLAIA